MRSILNEWDSVQFHCRHPTGNAGIGRGAASGGSRTAPTPENNLAVRGYPNL